MSILCGPLRHNHQGPYHYLRLFERQQRSLSHATAHDHHQARFISHPILPTLSCKYIWYPPCPFIPTASTPAINLGSRLSPQISQLYPGPYNFTTPLLPSAHHLLQLIKTQLSSSLSWEAFSMVSNWPHPGCASGAPSLLSLLFGYSASYFLAAAFCYWFVDIILPRRWQLAESSALTWSDSVNPFFSRKGTILRS